MSNRVSPTGAPEPDRSERAKLAAWTSDLDPSLAPPVRLLIVTLLAERRWCEFGAICHAVGITPPTLSNHIVQLRAYRYVEIHRDAHRIWVRLTVGGGERLLNHLEALQAIVARAAELCGGRDGSPERKTRDGSGVSSQAGF